jgi:hypothetical protein
MKKLLVLFIFLLMIVSCGEENGAETSTDPNTQGTLAGDVPPSTGSIEGSPPEAAVQLMGSCGGLDQEAKNMLIKMAYDETIHPDADFVRNNEQEIRAITILILNRANSAFWIYDATRTLYLDKYGTESLALEGINSNPDSLSDRLRTVLLASGQFDPATAYPTWYSGGGAASPLSEMMVEQGYSSEQISSISPLYEDIVCSTVESYPAGLEECSGIYCDLRTYCYYAANYAINPCGDTTAQTKEFSYKYCENLNEQECYSSERYGCGWYPDDPDIKCRSAYTIYYDCDYAWESCTLDLLDSGSNLVEGAEPPTEEQNLNQDMLPLSGDECGANHNCDGANNYCFHDNCCGNANGDTTPCGCECSGGFHPKSVTAGRRCDCYKIGEEPVQPQDNIPKQVNPGKFCNSIGTSDGNFICSAQCCSNNVPPGPIDCQGNPGVWVTTGTCNQR